MKTLSLYLIPITFLALGAAQIMIAIPAPWSFEYSMLAAMASSIIIMIAVLCHEYKSNKSSSAKSYVTWPAFSSALIAMHIELFSALLWIMFYLEKIMGALGM